MSNQSVCILGRQPAIGLAELESLFGPNNLRPAGAGSHAALLNLDPARVPIDRLGGTIKVCKLLTPLPFTDWPSIHKYLSDALPRHLEFIPEGKIRLGLSVYGLNVTSTKINSSALALKKIIQAADRSVRVVPNKAPQLNTAQVLHNQLTGATGMELVLIADGSQTILAQTTAVQDIVAYGQRDQNRPKRDARVGMLPPKLAQIIINLAVREQASRPLTILDPFCGTGVILQEALLMGYRAYGSDIDQRMVDYSGANLRWFQFRPDSWELETADATDHRWQPFDVVASETYLGRPFSAAPKPEILDQVVRDVDTIHQKFFKNLAQQTKPGLPICLALPAWHTKNGFRHLPSLDRLTDMGYTRASFVHAKNEDLIYHREGQIVARELVVITRN